MLLATVNIKRDSAKSILRREPLKLNLSRGSQNILELSKGLKLIGKIVRQGNSSDLHSKKPRLRKSKTIGEEKNKLS